MEALELRDAEFVLSDAATPPDDHAGWRPQALPDLWRDNHPPMAGGGWYRLRFRGEDFDQRLSAVYLPKAGLNAAVYLNGVLIGDGGSFIEPIGRTWNWPLLFTIPPGLLHPGENILHVRLLAHPYSQPSLHPLYVGPERAMRVRFEREKFLRITINQAATLLIAGIGILMLSMWWYRKQDTAYGYFGFSAMAWAAHSLNLYLPQAPLPTAQWEIFVNADVQVFSSLLLMSLLRFSAAGGGSLIPLLWGGAFLSPITLMLVPAAHFILLTSLWHLYTVLCTLATCIVLLRAAVGQKNRDARLMSFAIGIVLVLGTHDWLLHSRHLWKGHEQMLTEGVQLMQYSAPIVFLAVGLIMMSRFVQVFNEFESLNDKLEQKVTEKHIQLEQNFARMAGLEMERAVSEERERIYQDLHDDVGAKLLSLVYRAETPDNAALARSALEELREVVSHAGVDAQPVENVLADWRVESEQRLTEAGIVLDWRQGELGLISLTPPQILDFGRILREALSNVIRHSSASQVAITLDWDGLNLTLEVRDNGIGCAKSNPGGGRGLRNMEKRARRLGAELSHHVGVQQGCVVSLRIPIDAKALHHEPANGRKGESP